MGFLCATGPQRTRYLIWQIGFDACQALLADGTFDEYCRTWVLPGDEE
jgi:hypothetical protein